MISTGPDTPEVLVDDTRKAGKVFTQRVLEMMLDSIDDKQVLSQIKAKLVHPMLHSIFTQLYPYLIFVIVLMTVVLLMNMACCSLFIVNTCLRRGGAKS